MDVFARVAVRHVCDDIGEGLSDLLFDRQRSRGAFCERDHWLHVLIAGVLLVFCIDGEIAKYFNVLLVGAPVRRNRLFELEELLLELLFKILRGCISYRVILIIFENQEDLPHLLHRAALHFLVLIGRH